MKHKLLVLLIVIIFDISINDTNARGREEITGWCRHGYEINGVLKTTISSIYATTTNGHCPEPPHDSAPGSANATAVKTTSYTIGNDPIIEHHDPLDEKCRIIVTPPNIL